nr:bifunctional riboflavin biosynthesis protein riba 1, chloroplastic [Quercus suber]
MTETEEELEKNKLVRINPGILAKVTCISINKSILQKYASEDVSLGSWFSGLEVEHIDEHVLLQVGFSGEVVLKDYSGLLKKWDLMLLSGAKGEIGDGQDILVRVHSECLTGDIFGSARCDCGNQLALAMKQIEATGRGVLVYLRGHEGRGIGLGHKLRAYNLQDDGRDTVEANEELGLPVDSREYGLGAQILRDIGVRTMRLMTNNPAKYIGLKGYGLAIAGRVPLLTPITMENKRYLETKREKMGHIYGLENNGHPPLSKSNRCDCGNQLALAMKQIEATGRGVLVYLRGHEGRGIGLGHKLRAYNLQDDGRDTVEANEELGLPVDSREYGLGAQILRDIGVRTMRLMTNNPAKYIGVKGYGLAIAGRVPLLTPITMENKRYLETKREKMGHIYGLENNGHINGNGIIGENGNLSDDRPLGGSSES